MTSLEAKRLGEIVGDRFEVGELAGTGAMGLVYRGLDRDSGSACAIKVLRGRGIVESSRFTREARVLAELRHPRIVRFIASGVSRTGELYLVTEWLEGEDLSRTLARRALSLSESVSFALGVAEGLGFAHRIGVVHRDIKPKNLFLVEGRASAAKVLDFGIARFGGRATAVRTLTQTGSLLGTPGYMSPEQARGEKVIDARADVFSLGCVLWKCIVGRPPFLGEDMLEALLKLVIEETPRLGEALAAKGDGLVVPDALDDLLARMLDKSPAGRPPDGGAVAAELATIEKLVAEGASFRAPEARRCIGEIERRASCAVLARARGPRKEVDESTRVVELDAPTRVAPLGYEDSRTSRDEPASGSETHDGEPTNVDRESPFEEQAELARIAELEAAARTHGGRLEVLPDGFIVVAAATAGAFTDQAARAARIALALKPLLPGAPIAVVAGRADPTAGSMRGAIIERALALIASEEATAPEATGEDVRIDEVIAALLGTTFDVRARGDRIVLHGEREAGPARTFHGRVTPYVGRERELDALVSIFDEVASEPVARVVRILGPAGVGKSRLRHELVERLSARAASGPPFRLLSGRGESSRSGTPYAVAGHVVRSAAGIRLASSIERRRRQLVEHVGRRLAGEEASRVAEILGEIVGAPFGGDADDEGDRLRAVRRDPALMADEIRRAFEDYLAAECRDAPLILILEDLEHGDPASLKLIDGVLRSLRDRPILVVAVARPEIDQRFPGLWAGRPVTDLKLRELTKRNAERLVRMSLEAAAKGGGKEASLDQAGVDRIVALAGGNAFYLEELMRAGAADANTALPETILAMVQARLDELGAERRRLLRAASVLGDVFWPGGVIALLGDESRDPELRAMIDDLVERDTLERRPASRFPEEIELAFRQAIVREGAYAMLTTSDRRNGHRLAAEWLDSMGAADEAAAHRDRIPTP